MFDMQVAGASHKEKKQLESQTLSSLNNQLNPSSLKKEGHAD